MRGLLWPSVIVVVGCGGAGTPTTQEPAAAAPACDAGQAAISRDADTRAAPWSIARHLAKSFPDGRVSWLMRNEKYQEYVVKPAAKKWGRCNDTGCYLFAAPAAVIRAEVTRSMSDGRHDPAALGKALGLPAASLEGPLRMMTLDTGKAGACVRLPMETDPGAEPCKTAAETACFKFGGYTSGGVPELLVIDAPVDQTAIEEVP